VQRGLTLWVLRNRHEKVLHLQSLDLVEQIQLDMAISVDEAIAEQLASRGEISAPDVQAAVDWLTDQFISADDAATAEWSVSFLVASTTLPMKVSFCLERGGEDRQTRCGRAETHERHTSQGH
jgi:hypothetical protein